MVTDALENLGALPGRDWLMPDELATMESQPPSAADGPAGGAPPAPHARPRRPPERNAAPPPGGRPATPPRRGAGDGGEPEGEGDAAAKKAPAGESNKRWYVVKVQSGREESIKEAIERRVKI